MSIQKSGEARKRMRRTTIIGNWPETRELPDQTGEVGQSLGEIVRDDADESPATTHVQQYTKRKEKITGGL